jgi:hypothetical protein
MYRSSKAQEKVQSQKKLFFSYRITNGQNVRLINHAFQIPERLLPQVSLQQQGEVQG